MSSGQRYRPPQAASVTRPAPALPSHTLRNVLIVFVLLLGGLVAYAYSQNPVGCQKVLTDSRDVVVSLVPPGLIPNGILHGTPAASQAQSSPGDPSSATQDSPTQPPAPVAVFPAQPNWTWTTLDGKTYQNVVINKIDADTVSITHSTGVSHLPINMLSDDVKKQLHASPPPPAAMPSAP